MEISVKRDIRKIFLVSFIEFKNFFTSRWTLIYFLIFSIVFIFIVFSSFSETEIFGFRSATKSLTAIINFSVIIVPLFSLLSSSLSISSSRENFSLEYLKTIADYKRIVLGKFFGIFFSNCVPVILSFFFGFVLILSRGTVPISTFSKIIFIMVSLIFLFSSLGILISSYSSGRLKSVIYSLSLWFLLVFVGEFGIANLMVIKELPIKILSLIVLNPIESVRIFLLSLFDIDPGVLGPVGFYIVKKMDLPLILTMEILIFSFLFLSFALFEKKD